MFSSFLAKTILHATQAPFISSKHTPVDQSSHRLPFHPHYPPSQSQTCRPILPLPLHTRHMVQRLLPPSIKPQIKPSITLAWHRHPSQSATPINRCHFAFCFGPKRMQNGSVVEQLQKSAHFWERTLEIFRFGWDRIDGEWVCLSYLPNFDCQCQSRDDAEVLGKKRELHTVGVPERLECFLS